MEKINGLKETPRKAENKVKKKKLRKVMEKRKKVYKKRRSFKELVKGTSLKGKLDWEVSK